jgi:electron transport complex protein RnfG
MSATTQLGGVPTPTTSVWQMYRAMVGIGVLCGLLIVSVFVVTRPIIERNKAEALQRAIFQVLPQARSSATFLLVDEGAGDGGIGIVLFRRVEQPAGPEDQGRLVYAGYDENDRLVGLAVEASGMGYQDVIHLLYGYSFEQNAVIGLQILESKETPGLGDRIEKDPEFLRNFEQLDVSLNEAGTAPAHPIEPVKHGDKQHPWQVDGITGATISSVAIANILSSSTAYWVPRLHEHRDDFQTATRSEG